MRIAMSVKSIRQDRLEMCEKRLDKILRILGENPDGMSLLQKLKKIETVSESLVIIASLAEKEILRK